MHCRQILYQLSHKGTPRVISYKYRINFTPNKIFTNLGNIKTEDQVGAGSIFILSNFLSFLKNICVYIYMCVCIYVYIHIYIFDSAGS